MFHIVVFDKTNEVEVVPSPHKARIIFTSFGYKEARRKLPLAVDHTDIDQTDGGNSPITFQRKRKPKNILFPGEDDDREMEGHQKEPKSKKGRRYSIPDAPKIARQHKLDPGKPSCSKLCHSTPDLPNDEMKRIKGTKSRKRRHALPTCNAPVTTREQISPVVDNLHLSGQSSPDVSPHGQSSPDVSPHGQSSPDVSPHGQSGPDVSPHGQSSPDVSPHGQSSPDVSPHGQSSPQLRPHGQMSHNLRPSCYYSPDLYADGHSTPEIHSSPQTSTTMLSSGWHVRSESCTSAAVRRNHLTSEATEKEIDSTVKRWLYLAPDRDGCRKERMKNKVSEESTTG
ncbi:uncharacterized protein LOC113085053 isoform X1 [Tachysurus ichikawai]